MVGEWPGNVRQLTNEVQRLVARAEDLALITPDHLSAELRRTPVPDHSSSRSAIDLNGKGFWEGMSFPDVVDQLEKLMISATLEKHNGNISRTARDLGITRRGLQLKLARY